MNDNIIVKRDDPEEETQEGLLLPEQTRELKQTGTVLAVGPGKIIKSGKRVPMEFKVGDKVLIGNVVSYIHHDGEDVLIVQEKNILGILT